MNQADRIRSINDIGWDGVNAENQTTKLTSANLQKELDIQFKRCFETESGKKVLEHLVNITVRQDKTHWLGKSSKE